MDHAAGRGLADAFRLAQCPGRRRGGADPVHLVLFLVAASWLLGGRDAPRCGRQLQAFHAQRFGRSFSAVPVAVYAFMGASTVLFASEEARDPVDVARVLLWSSITFVTVYTWALFAAVGTVPHGEGGGEVSRVALCDVGQPGLRSRLRNALNAAAWTAAGHLFCSWERSISRRGIFTIWLGRATAFLPGWASFIGVTDSFSEYWLVWGSPSSLSFGARRSGQTMIYQLLSYEVVWVLVRLMGADVAGGLRLPFTLCRGAGGIPWKVPLCR